MTNVRQLHSSKTAVNLEAIRMSTQPRKRKRYVFVFDMPSLAPERIRFDESATLRRDIPWGKPDKALGDTICGELPKVMPAQGKGLGTPWQWQPRPYVPRWVGYLGIAVLVASALAGFSR